MAEHDWKQLLRLPGVDDVVTRAIRAVESRRTHTLGTKDDFESFAWDHAVHLAEKYVGEPDDGFLRWLYASLTGYGALQHYGETFGHPDGTRRRITTRTVSMEQHQEAIGDTRLDIALSAFSDLPVPSERHTGPGPLSHRLTREDPLAVLLWLENLERAVRQAAIRARHADGFVTDTAAAGLYCAEALCLKPPHTAGYCRGHYSRHRRMWGRADGTSVTCDEPACNAVATARGLCHEHYVPELRRRKEAGDLWVDEPPGECSEPGCDRTAKKKGLCTLHYQRARIASQRPCQTPGCTNPALAKGQCSTHYKNSRRQAGIDHDRA